MILFNQFVDQTVSVMLRSARIAPKLITLAVVSLLGLSAGPVSSSDPDDDGDDARRSIAYRHYL